MGVRIDLPFVLPALVVVACGGEIVGTKSTSDGGAPDGSTDDGTLSGPTDSSMSSEAVGPGGPEASTFGPAVVISGTGCLPESLVPDASGDVPCIILVTLAPSAAHSASREATACNEPDLGLSMPSSETLRAIRADQHRVWLSPPNSMHGVDPSTLATCEMHQIPYRAGSSCVGG
jgi:hypothetical protein